MIPAYDDTGFRASPDDPGRPLSPIRASVQDVLT